MIEIQAANIDKALFRISKAGIELVGVSRVSRTCLQARADARSIRRISGLLMGSERLRILKHGGIAGLGSALKRHCALWVGVLLLTIGMVYLSGCCLELEVSGNERIATESIRDMVYACGLQLWHPKEMALPGQLEVQLQQAFPEFRYVYAAYEGTKLHIRVRETYQTPPISQTEPCAIYAAQDGVIQSITVYCGQAMVQPGDRVQAGDLLIAGRYTKGEREFNVHAAGEVLAATEQRATVLLTAEQRCSPLPTGEQAEGYCLRIGNRTVPLQGENPFSESRVQEQTVAAMGENSPLTLRIVKQTYVQTALQPDAQKQDAEVFLQKQRVYARLTRDLAAGDTVQAFDIYEQEKGQALQLICTLQAIRQIGREGQQNPPGEAAQTG